MEGGCCLDHERAQGRGLEDGGTAASGVRLKDIASL